MVRRSPMPGKVCRFGTKDGFNASEMGKALYKKLGFVETGMVEQHQCRELPSVMVVAPVHNVAMRVARREDTDVLVALERQAHGQYRPELIASLFDSAERFLLLERAGRITGFACQRSFGHGQAIGPVIAEDLAGAKVLVSELLSGLDDWLNALGIGHPLPWSEVWHGSLTACSHSG
ncbi:hypothetical protein LU604_15305 [Erwinia tracheiphila]|nr:hypothetical protein [Erwinia tracheiphila]UIA82013.1 hypothetical protein LU604_15305 [Erwinia tracheiphila]UIA90609.1 hypothetical protein LU632_14870 [Erwinia tracheiphila]